MKTLPLRARIFVVLVAVAAAPLPFVAFAHVYPGIDVSVYVGLGLLIVLTDSFGARGSRDMMTIALSSVVSSASLPLVGGWGAIVVASATALGWVREPLVKRVFNASQMILAAAAAAAVYTWLGGTPLQKDSFPSLLVPFTAALVTHCVVNGTLVALVVSLDQGVPVRVVFQGTMVQSLPNYVGYGLFGLLLAVLWAGSGHGGAGVGPVSAILLLLPLVVARWAYAQYAEEQRAYDRTVRALMAAVETKDLYTRGHSERVSAASVLIARAIGMREDRVASLRYAGMLHDIGKLGVPTRVLQKTGQLDDAEYAAVQRHPMQGLEIVREIEFLTEANAGIMHHHERLDGLGYPMGLSGDRIPEFARVIAVADAFDSMTTTRSYRPPRSVADAILELRRCAGTQFDPPMVEALVRALDEHGWDPETVPVFPVPADDEQVFDQELASFDHDDPTSTLVDDSW